MISDLLPALLQITRLRYTPRKFALHPEHKSLIVVEADHAAVPLAQRQAESSEASTSLAQVLTHKCLISCSLTGLKLRADPFKELKPFGCIIRKLEDLMRQPCDMYQA